MYLISGEMKYSYAMPTYIIIWEEKAMSFSCYVVASKTVIKKENPFGELIRW